MHFEGILKGYLKAVATGSTGLVAGGSSIRKREGNRNCGLVGSGFQSFSGPCNWTFKHYLLGSNYCVGLIYVLLIICILIFYRNLKKCLIDRICAFSPLCILWTLTTLKTLLIS